MPKIKTISSIQYEIVCEFQDLTFVNRTFMNSHKFYFGELNGDLITIKQYPINESIEMQIKEQEKLQNRNEDYLNVVTSYKRHNKNYIVTEY